MPTYQITATLEVDADNESEALDTFAEAVADDSADITVVVLGVQR